MNISATCAACPTPSVFYHIITVIWEDDRHTVKVHITDFYVSSYQFFPLNTLWTGDPDLRLYITNVQDG